MRIKQAMLNGILGEDINKLWPPGRGLTVDEFPLTLLTVPLTLPTAPLTLLTVPLTLLPMPWLYLLGTRGFVS